MKLITDAPEAVATMFLFCCYLLLARSALPYLSVSRTMQILCAVLCSFDCCFQDPLCMRVPHVLNISLNQWRFFSADISLEQGTVQSLGRSCYCTERLPTQHTALSLSLCLSLSPVLMNGAFRCVRRLTQENVADDIQIMYFVI